MSKKIPHWVSAVSIAIATAIILGAGSIILEANDKPTMPEVEKRIDEKIEGKAELWDHIHDELNQKIDTLANQSKVFQAETRGSLQSVIILQLRLADKWNIELPQEIKDDLEKKTGIKWISP